MQKNKNLPGWKLISKGFSGSLDSKSAKIAAVVCEEIMKILSNRLTGSYFRFMEPKPRTETASGGHDGMGEAIAMHYFFAWGQTSAYGGKEYIGPKRKSASLAAKDCEVFLKKHPTGQCTVEIGKEK